MAVNPALHAEASNPSTDPARLAAIAAEEPALGAVIAANPAAYEGLLDWLAQYGDPAAQHAVAVRRGTAAPAAPAQSATAPATTPRAPLSSAAKKGILFGGIGVAAAAVVTIAAVVLVNTLSGSGSSSAITVVDITDEPRDDAWEIISPLAEDADEDSTLGAQVRTVAQDRALVTWIATGEDSLTSLVDTRSGSILWTIDDFEEEITVVSAPGATPFIVESDEVLYAVDPSNGDIISDTSKLDDPYLISDNSYGYNAGDLGSDLLLLVDDEIGLYPASELDEPRWTVDWDDSDGYPVLAGNRVIVGESAFDARTGEDVEWDGDDDVSYFGLNGKIYGQEGGSGEGDLMAFSESGEELWSADYAGTLSYFDEKRVVFFNEDDDELTAINLDSGEELWTVDAEYNGGYTYGRAEAAGVFIVPAGDDGEATAFDLENGEELYSFEASDGSSVTLYLIGAGSRVLYFAGGEDGELVALGARDGEELWSLSGDDGLGFFVAGGNLVSVSRVDGDDAQDDAVLRGIQP